MTTVCSGNCLKEYQSRGNGCRSNNTIVNINILRIGRTSENTADTTRPARSAVRNQASLDYVVGNVDLHRVGAVSGNVSNKTSDVVCRGSSNCCFGINAIDRVDTAVTHNVTDHAARIRCSLDLCICIDHNTVDDNVNFGSITKRTAKQSTGRTCRIRNVTAKNLDVLYRDSRPSTDPMSDQTRAVGSVCSNHRDVFEGNVLHRTARNSFGNQRLGLRCICRTDVLDGVALSVERSIERHGAKQRGKSCALSINVTAK